MLVEVLVVNRVDTEPVIHLHFVTPVHRLEARRAVARDGAGDFAERRVPNAMPQEPITINRPRKVQLRERRAGFSEDRVILQMPRMVPRDEILLSEVIAKFKEILRSWRAHNNRYGKFIELVEPLIPLAVQLPLLVDKPL